MVWIFGKQKENAVNAYLAMPESGAKARAGYYLAEAKDLTQKDLRNDDKLVAIVNSIRTHELNGLNTEAQVMKFNLGFDEGVYRNTLVAKGIDLYALIKDKKKDDNCGQEYCIEHYTNIGMHDIASKKILLTDITDRYQKSAAMLIKMTDIFRDAGLERAAEHMLKSRGTSFSELERYQRQADRGKEMTAKKVLALNNISNGYSNREDPQTLIDGVNNFVNAVRRVRESYAQKLLREN